jgi:cell wall-associated NlpC family hydrolase
MRRYWNASSQGLLAMTTALITRTARVTAARGRIGTRYRHQQSRRGVGRDCLGLVRIV